ncbi:MAG: hypothetical protein JW723_02505, partial [Bacteroidales bacterium]|nr:hypothetical protein [Bacteroidales bacterium]
FNAYQTSVKLELPLSANSDYYQSNLFLEAYLPVVTSKAFSVLWGTSYSKNTILAEKKELNEPLMQVCLTWFSLQYELRRWKFFLVNEVYQRGNNYSLLLSTGNEFRSFAFAAYALGEKWQIIPMAGYFRTNKENEIRNSVFPAIQCRYEPSDRFRVLFGLPVICAFEWNMLPGTDVSFEQIMDNHTAAFIRYRISGKIGISVHYRNTDYSSSDTYFAARDAILDGEQYTYNNMTQQQQSVSLEIGFRTFRNIGVFLTAGYHAGNKIRLYNNNDHVKDESGGKGFFTGIHLQHLKYF